jgi:hypothetical protein
MSYGKENVAYDLSIFEPRDNALRKSKKDEKPQLKSIPGQGKKKSVPAALKYFALCATVMAALIYFMVGNVKINVLSNEITAAQKKLDSALSEQTSLNVQLEGRMSLQNVENYAVNTLGLEKVGEYQIEYVSLTNENHVQVSSGQQNPIIKIFLSIYTRVLEYLK